jgi:hypothetical protein
MNQRDRKDKQMTSKRAPTKALRRVTDSFRTPFARRRSRSGISGRERELTRAGTPADVTSIRAKSSRHGKSTADKWNQ